MELFFLLVKSGAELMKPKEGLGKWSRNKNSNDKNDVFLPIQHPNEPPSEGPLHLPLDHLFKPDTPPKRNVPFVLKFLCCTKVTSNQTERTPRPVRGPNMRPPKQ